jgi:hypothetical protein
MVIEKTGDDEEKSNTNDCTEAVSDLCIAETVWGEGRG